jgi:exodeoxyribonuclease VII large subunit
MNLISNIKEYTVSELNSSIKNIMEKNFNIVKVRGEISQTNKHSSGHIYFTLKDGNSIISSICWRSTVPRLNIKIEDGINVIVKGRVTTYEHQSKYQIIIDQVDYEGEGELLKTLEQRKKKLSRLGYFDSKNKKPIPKIPTRIGVITSETGAVIKDIIHRVSERFPLEILLYPANVQGEKSLKDLVCGINYFNNALLAPDLIIIARGGGSLEDLMSFNEEELVKKISESNIPIISAVGHETDFTLCDLVADLRAPTPTAAAEIAVPERKDLFYKVNSCCSLMSNLLLKKISEKKLNLEIFTTKIPNITNLINSNYQSLDFFELKIKDSLDIILKNSKIKFFRKVEKLNKKILYQRIFFFYEKISVLNKSIKIQLNNLVQSKKSLITSSSRQLALLSYKNILRRGFSVIKYNQTLVKDENQINKGEIFEVEFYKSKLKAKKI